jgi:hypothetical protein
MLNDEISSFIIHHLSVDIDTSRWSGDGDFTARLIEVIRSMPDVALLKVEDAPATRTDSAFSFISNELFVAFNSTTRTVRARRFGVIPVVRQVAEKAMSLAGLEAALTAAEGVGPPDYGDEKMLQYLRTERVIPPYQTRGVKLVELVRIYEVG